MRRIRREPVVAPMPRRFARDRQGASSMQTDSRSELPARQLERKLVRRMVSGDEAAFESFADLYIPVMYRFAQHRLAGDPELTREIVQATLSKVIPKLATFRGEAALTTWLCSCCRNEIAAHYRRASRRPREVDLDHEPVAVEAARRRQAGDGPEGGLLRRERAALVHRALDELPAHYGRALEWKYLENLTVREIGRRLELGPKAAESLLTRARLAFREVFARLAPDELNPKTAVRP